MNSYLDHFLDRWWLRLHPDVPLLRFVDDIVILCPPEDNAPNLHAELQARLLSCGMPLKGTAASAIGDLRSHDVRWLGFDHRLGPLGLEMRLPSDGEVAKWEERLREACALADTKSDPSYIVWKSTEGFIDQAAPAFPFSDVPTIWKRIMAIAQEFAFDELPDLKAFQRRWRSAYKRWCAIRLAAWDLGYDAAHPRTPPAPAQASRPRLQAKKHFLLVTDGSYLGDEAGGWAYARLERGSGGPTFYSGSLRCATANQAELTAAIRALQSVPEGSGVVLIGDSKYLMLGLGRMRIWKSRGWRTAAGRRVKNLDLWQQLDRLVEQRDVACRWKRGHSGHRLLDHCDRLAGEAAENSKQQPGEPVLV